MKKLFIDDIRKIPDDSWTLARNVSEAIRAINMFDFDVISLDHDIEGSQETFDTVALFIAEKYKETPLKSDKNMFRPKIILHTANPVGALKMKNILEGFEVEIKERGFN